MNRQAGSQTADAAETDSQVEGKEQSVHLVWLPLIIKSGEQKNLLPVWNSAEDSSGQEKNPPLTQAQKTPDYRMAERICLENQTKTGKK